MKNLKKICSKILSLAMVFFVACSSVPLTAQAANEIATPDEPRNAVSNDAAPIASLDEIILGTTGGYANTEDGLKQAITAINAGGTIKLGGNLPVTGSISITDKSVTLDMNGKNITCTPSSGQSVFSISGSAQMTVKGTENATIVSGSTGRVFDVAGGTLTLENVNMESSGNDALLKTTDGTANINGGKFSNTVNSSSSMITVTGGTLNVDSGTLFEIKKAYALYYNSGNVVLKTASFDVSGGTGAIISTGNILELIASDYEAMEFAPDSTNAVEGLDKLNEYVGSMRIAPIQKLSDITLGTTVGYPNTLEGMKRAIRNIEVNGTIKLGANIEMSELKIARGPITLDMNGFNITATSDYVFNVAAGGEVTITNTNKAQGGEIAACASKSAILVYGKATINKIKISALNNSSTGINVYSGGEATFEDGEISVSGTDSYGIKVKGGGNSLAKLTIKRGKFYSDGASAVSLDSVDGNVVLMGGTFHTANGSTAIKSNNNISGFISSGYEAADQNGTVITGLNNSLEYKNYIKIRRSGQNEITLGSVDYPNTAEGLEQAIENIAPNGTIKLQEALNMDAGIEVSGAAFTLDLNGKNIVGSGKKGEEPVFTIKSGTMTIKGEAPAGGSISSDSTIFDVWKDGKLTVESGTYETGKSGADADGILSNSGTVTINGGTFRTGKGTSAILAKAGSKLTVFDGSFDSKEASILQVMDASAVVSLKKCTFHMENEAKKSIVIDDIINKKVSDFIAADSSKAVKTSDGSVIDVSALNGKSYVGSIGIEYSKIVLGTTEGFGATQAGMEKAVASIGKGGVIQIESMNDMALNKTVVVENTFTLDLNGNSLSGPDNTFQIKGTGHMTIMDSTSNKSGSINALNSGTVFDVQGGTLDWVSGDAAAGENGSAVKISSGGKVTIKGGTFMSAAMAKIFAIEDGTLTMVGGKIENNHTDAVGLYHTGGTVVLKKGVVFDTKAGITIKSTTKNISELIFTGCKGADANGKGIKGLDKTKSYSRSLTIVEKGIEEIILGVTPGYANTADGFKKAMGVIDSEGTIKLSTELECTADFDINSSFTFDLNGCKINSGVLTGYKIKFNIKSGTVTVTDSKGSSGTVYSNGSEMFQVEKAGTLIIEGGKFARYQDNPIISNAGTVILRNGQMNDAGASEKSSAPITVAAGADLTIEGTVTINCDAAISTSGNTIIRDGVINSVVVLGGRLKVTGGSINYLHVRSQNAVINLRGAYFRNGIGIAEEVNKKVKDLIPAGCRATMRDGSPILGEGALDKTSYDSPIRIVCDQISLGTTDYPNTAEGIRMAMSDISTDGVISVTADVTVTEPIVVEESSFVLDTAGFNLTGPLMDSLFIIRDGGKMTVKNSDDSLKGAISTGSDNSAFAVEGGAFIFESGTLQTSTGGKGIAVSGGAVTVKDGIFNDAVKGHIINVQGGTLTLEGGTFRIADADAVALYHEVGTVVLKGAVFNTENGTSIESSQFLSKLLFSDSKAWNADDLEIKNLDTIKNCKDTIKIMAKKPVILVGATVEYPNTQKGMEKAIHDVDEDGIIKLGTVMEALPGVIVVNKKSFTLDLNGQELTCVNGAFKIENNTLTVIDSSTDGVISTQGDKKVFEVGQNGTLIVKSGIFRSEGQILESTGTASIKGGTFEGAEAYNAINIIGGKLTILGGKFSSTGAAPLMIEDGTSVFLKGGTFTGSPDSIKIGENVNKTIAGLIPEHYIPVDVNDNKITTGLDGKTYSGIITIVPTFITLGTTEGYDSTEEDLGRAIKDVYKKGTVQLGKALTMTKQVQSKNTFTFDLNGQVLTCPDTTNAFYFSEGDVIIKDSKTGGSITGKKGRTMFSLGTSKTKLTIESGIFNAKQVGSQVISASATSITSPVTIKGGTFNCSGAGATVITTAGPTAIKGGTFNVAGAASGVIAKKGSLGIEGGTFNSNGGKAALQVSGDAAVSLTGGAFIGKGCSILIDSSVNKNILHLIPQGYGPQNEKNIFIFSSLENSKSYNGTIKIVSHKHTGATGWKKDAKNHWHGCAVGCDKKLDLVAHTAGGWIIDKKATTTAMGQRHKQCTVCGYVMQTEKTPIIHIASKTWSKDTKYHWHDCVAKDGKKFDKAAHTSSKWITKNGAKYKNCKVCGQILKVAEFTSGNYKYKVTGTKTASLAGFAKGKSSSTVSVKKTVTFKGTTYKITSVADKAFYKNTKVQKVSINYVTKIGKGAFAYCKNLKQASFGNTVQELSYSLFYRCGKLQKVTIGTGLKKMEKNTFNRNTSLRSITIKSTKLTKITGRNNLYKCRKLKIKVPASKVKAYSKLFKNQGADKKTLTITK